MLLYTKKLKLTLKEKFIRERSRWEVLNSARSPHSSIFWTNENIIEISNRKTETQLKQQDHMFKRKLRSVYHKHGVDVMWVLSYSELQNDCIIFMFKECSEF